MIFHQSVIRMRAGTRTDRGGNTVKDWASASRLQVDRLNVQPSSQTESVDETRDAVVTGWRVYSEPGTNPDVRHDDRIEHDGVTCDIDGEVARWPDPLTGSVHHAEWSMRRSVG